MFAHMDPITSTEALAAACDRLSRHDFVTVDTEFLRETTFWPKLCLIQAASPEEAIVVDALAPDLDLAPFFRLMADERVTKVFHAARQDIEIVWHQAGLIPHPVFDTQVAAMALGFGDSISYDNLVQRVLKKQIDKSSQFTDWMRRPLSQKQLVYALGDVTHLRDAYQIMRDELERTDRMTWVREEMSDLEDPATYDTEPMNAWQRLKLRMPKKDYAAVVVSVAAWRERVAQELDKPRRRILKDDAIQEIAAQKPRTEEDFNQLRAVPSGFIRSKHGQGLLDAVRAAIDAPDSYAPEMSRPAQNAQIPAGAPELLKVLLKHVSDENDVVPRLIANSADIDRIARGETSEDIAAMTGWRYDMFGKKAIALLSGKLAVSFAGGQVRLFDV